MGTVGTRFAALAIMAGLLVATTAAFSPAGAEPVIREAAGANAAAIQDAVVAFRSDLGDPNNANAPGSQPAGRREINWDGGGATAPPTPFSSPMTTFSNRGAVFVTPGQGFQISGALDGTEEFFDIDPTYPTFFAAFSPERLFTPLGSNVTEVLFTVPGTTDVAAAVTGFGAVFTDVDSASSTKIELWGPNGEFLLERFVLPATGNNTLSFLGVSFDQGELVGRVRITSGNRAIGPGIVADDIVVMDDFLYGEPVSTAGLIITPGSGPLFTNGVFDLTVGIIPPDGVTVTGGSATFNALDVGADLGQCIQLGTIVGGGQTFRCAGVNLPSGTHTLNIVLNLSDGTRRRNAVTWDVLQATEP